MLEAVARLDRQAGTVPKTIPVTIETARVNARTRPSIENRVQARDLGGGHRNQQRQRPVRDEKRDRAARRREQHALREKLPQEAPPARSERLPHRELPLAPGRAREEKARDVGASDQENESDRDQENDERRLHLGDEILLERKDQNAVAGARRIGFGKFPLEPCGHEIELGASGLDGGAILESADDSHEVRGPGTRAVRLQGQREAKGPRSPRGIGTTAA